MWSSGLKALLFITPRLPGCSLMTFSSKSSNSWPAGQVRNPRIICTHLPAWSSLASAVSHIPPKTVLQTPKYALTLHFISISETQGQVWKHETKQHWQSLLHSPFPHQWVTQARLSSVAFPPSHAGLEPAKDPSAQTAEMRTLRHGAGCRKLHRQPKSPRWELRTNGTSINNIHLSSTQNSLLEANSEQGLGVRNWTPYFINGSGGWLCCAAACQQQGEVI